MQAVHPDLDDAELAVLEELARETGKRLCRDAIPERLIRAGLVVRDGACFKLAKPGWCVLMFAGRAGTRR